jgi:CheY-like chemotaxis protein
VSIPKNVLVLEDQQNQRNATAAWVEMAGGTPFVATDLSAAMVLLTERVFAAALVDLNMANGSIRDPMEFEDVHDAESRDNRDGMRLIPRIRKLGERTRCAVVSGHDDAPTIIKCFVEHQADNYFVKEWADRVVTPWLKTVFADWEMPSVKDVVEATAPPGWTRALWTQDLNKALNPTGKDELWAERYLGFMVSGFLPLKYPRMVKGSPVAFAGNHSQGVFVLNFWSRALGLPLLIVTGKAANVNDVEDKSRLTGRALDIELAPSNLQLRSPLDFEVSRPLPIRRYVTNQPRSFFVT